MRRRIAELAAAIEARDSFIAIAAHELLVTKFSHGAWQDQALAL